MALSIPGTVNTEKLPIVRWARPGTHGHHPGIPWAQIDSCELAILTTHRPML